MNQNWSKLLLGAVVAGLVSAQSANANEEAAAVAPETGDAVKKEDKNHCHVKDHCMHNDAAKSKKGKKAVKHKGTAPQVNKDAVPAPEHKAE